MKNTSKMKTYNKSLPPKTHAAHPSNSQLRPDQQYINSNSYIRTAILKWLKWRFLSTGIVTLKSYI